MDYRNSINSEAPPKYIIDKPAFKALWLAARGQWEQAHTLVRTLEDKNGGAWLHACIHRIEGDTNNAKYWYKRTGKKYYNGDTDKELEEIAVLMIRSFNSEE